MKLEDKETKQDLHFPGSSPQIKHRRLGKSPVFMNITILILNLFSAIGHIVSAYVKLYCSAKVVKTLIAIPSYRKVPLRSPVLLTKGQYCKHFEICVANFVSDNSARLLLLFLA